MVWAPIGYEMPVFGASEADGVCAAGAWMLDVDVLADVDSGDAMSALGHADVYRYGGGGLLPAEDRDAVVLSYCLYGMMMAAVLSAM